MKQVKQYLQVGNAILLQPHKNPLVPFNFSKTNQYNNIEEGNNNVKVSLTSVMFQSGGTKVPLHIHSLYISHLSSKLHLN